MVGPDTFLATWYVLVGDLLHVMPAPALVPSEVVPPALFGQWRRFGGERAFSRYAARHLRGAFPALPYRGQYNRLLRRSHAAVAAAGQALAGLLDAPTCAYEVLDSLGVVTRNGRRRGRRWLAGQAYSG